MNDPSLSRREFLSAAARWGAVLGGSGLLLSASEAGRLLGFPPADAAAGDALADLVRQAPVARYWAAAGSIVTPPGMTCTTCHTAAELKGVTSHVHEPPVLRCLLCAHRCTIAEGERGRCRSRMNVKGQLRSLVYGRPITEHVDPIEKKPFYHFLPGSAAYSLATSGCPLHCRFCQNWEISQARPEDYSSPIVPPETIVGRTRGAGAPVIAFTYNEPTVFIEYLADIARAGRKQGLRPVLISCGYMNEAPLAEMIEVLDAIKIDLKGFAPEFYRNVAGAELEPVLRSLRQVARAGRHLEIVNLVVPTLNDSDRMLTELARFVVGELGPDIPVHFTRFHPDYQLLNLSPTPVETLERAREIAMKAGIRYAYVGNVPGHPGNNTYCPACHAACIERSNFFVTAMHLENGACARCGTKIAGVWS